MHVITRKALMQFGRTHAKAVEPLRAWAKIMARARFATPLEVKAAFPSVDFIGPQKAVFNICRNEYRLVVDMRFDLGRIYIRHVVTHAEYDRLIARGAL